MPGTGLSSPSHADPDAKPFNGTPPFRADFNVSARFAGGDGTVWLTGQSWHLLSNGCVSLPFSLWAKSLWCRNCAEVGQVRAPFQTGIFEMVYAVSSPPPSASQSSLRRRLGRKHPKSAQYGTVRSWPVVSVSRIGALAGNFARLSPRAIFGVSLFQAPLLQGFSGNRVSRSHPAETAFAGRVKMNRPPPKAEPAARQGRRAGSGRVFGESRAGLIPFGQEN
jgi:hypothetical protein